MQCQIYSQHKITGKNKGITIFLKHGADHDKGAILWFYDDKDDKTNPDDEDHDENKVMIKVITIIIVTINTINLHNAHTINFHGDSNDKNIKISVIPPTSVKNSTNSSLIKPAKLVVVPPQRNAKSDLYFISARNLLNCFLYYTSYRRDPQLHINSNRIHACQMFMLSLMF